MNDAPILDPHDLLPAITSGSVRVLRQSTLGTADTCLQRLEFDLDPRIPYGTGEARAVGTGYHAGLEHYYRWRMQSGLAVPPDGWGPMMVDVNAAAMAAFDAEAATDGFQWDPESSHERAVSKIGRMLDEYFIGQECYWPETYTVVGVELTFITHAGRNGWVVKGTIDLILVDPEGWIIVVDHKTATRPWKKNKHLARSTNQPSWYMHFLGQLWGTDTLAFVFDVMTYDGKFERRPAERGKHENDAVLAKAQMVMQLIEQGGPFPPNVGSFLCSSRWCDHWQYCPFGEAMETGGGVARPGLQIVSPT